MHTGEAVA